MAENDKDPAPLFSSASSAKSAVHFELQIISPVEVGKYLRALFAFAKKIEIDLCGVELIVEAVEAQEMIFGPLRRVLRRAFGFDKEGPVTRLGEEKLAGSLSKRALDRGLGGVALTACDFRHAASGGVQVRINPRVAFLQPNTVEAMLAPTGGIWLNDLLRRMPGQKFGRRSELKILRARELRDGGSFRENAVLQTTSDQKARHRMD